jgi:hypothetical protein
MDEKYLSLADSGIDWYFTDPEICIPINDLYLIRPLTKEYSSELWNRHISSDAREKHFMLLNDDHWCLKNMEHLYNWRDDWNENDHEGFSKILNDRSICGNEDDIILFWMKERSVETKWRIFTKYWMNFLFEDEGMIIINDKSDKSIVLSNGDSWVIHR